MDQNIFQSSKTINHLKIFGGSLSFLSAFAGIAVLPDTFGKKIIIILLFLMGCLSLILYFASFFKKKSILYVTNKLELAQHSDSYALGKSIYDKIKVQYIDFNAYLKWINKYSKGVFHIKDQDDRLWGYLSMFPISEHAFEKIRDGNVKFEEEIDELMVLENSNNPFAYWYFADILKSDKLFHKNLKKNVFGEYIKTSLIFHVFNTLKKQRQFADSIEIIAFGVTPPGRALLKEYGFIKLLLSNKGDYYGDIYLRSINKKALEKMLKKLSTKLESLERSLKTVIEI